MGFWGDNHSSVANKSCSILSKQYNISKGQLSVYISPKRDNLRLRFKSIFITSYSSEPHGLSIAYVLQNWVRRLISWANKPSVSIQGLYFRSMERKSIDTVHFMYRFDNIYIKISFVGTLQMETWNTIT